MTRILVTGGQGMIGSALVRRLLQERPQWIIRATHRGGDPLASEGRLEWVQADLTLPEHCRKAAEGCQLAVMTAAETGGAQANQERPSRFLTNNLVMNAQLLQALAEAGVGRVLFLSTSMVYPALTRPVSEEDLDLNQEPPSPFEGIGWAMRCSEKLAHYWHRQRGMEVAILRLSYVYGPRARFAAGTSNFVPGLIRRTVDGQDPFEIWGDPEVVRDLLYVDDCCEALDRLLGLPELGWQVLNLSSGQGVRVGEVAQKILDLASHRPEILPRPTAPSTLPYRVVDNRRLRQLLDWQPPTTLEAGLGETLRWWQENRHRWTR